MRDNPLCGAALGAPSPPDPKSLTAECAARRLARVLSRVAKPCALSPSREGGTARRGLLHAHSPILAQRFRAALRARSFEQRLER
jgi:hypothetical protein